MVLPSFFAGRHVPDRRTAVRHGLVLAGVITAIWLHLVVGDPGWRSPLMDGLVYWGVDPSDPYRGAAVGAGGAYLYSPAFAQVFALIGLLPREVFMIAWPLLAAAVAVWLARPWPAALLVLALPLSEDLLSGNIHILLAGAIVLGLRWPAAWAFVLLTKVTPGVVLLWFVVRREWRSLAIALATTAVLVLISVAIAWRPWLDWIALLQRSGASGSSYLYLRILAAVGIIVWGAMTDRGWVVPVAGMLALPILWSNSFAMLLGAVALSGNRRRPEIVNRRVTTTSLRPVADPIVGAPSEPAATDAL
jgi:hypothetical protein